MYYAFFMCLCVCSGKYKKKKKMMMIMMMMMYYILCTLMGMYGMFHCHVKITRGINPQFPDTTCDSPVTYNWVLRCYAGTMWAPKR